MIAVVDNEDMFAIAFLIGIAALCLLGALYGVDSRHTDAQGHHRKNLL